MAYRIIIFMSIILITAESHSMNKVRKTKSVKRYKKDNNRYHSLSEELLVTQRIIDKKILLPEIAWHVMSYSLLLTHKRFENRQEPFIEKWHDFRIPISCCHFLTQKQMALTRNIIMSVPIQQTECDGIIMSNEIFYRLSSERKYKLFLTLPIQLRRCLSKKPLSLMQPSQYPFDDACLFLCSDCNNIRINQDKVIIVKNKYKPLLPEEIRKH